MNHAFCHRAGHHFHDFSVGIDQKCDTDRQVLDAYGVSPIPTTFLINPDGKVVKVVTGLPARLA
jgi:peroxiredoxin